jgi:ubiquinol-cytochrome c reductase cytochrome b subunit
MHIAPVWYFTPYYSILRATTEEFVLWALVPGLVAFALLIIWSVKSTATRVATGVTTIVLLLGLLTLDAKVWGVVLMGTSVMIFFLLPWLDRSPVKSIRYKGPITKAAIALFVIAFFVLGYLGTESVTGGRTLAAQIGTAVYFLFFLLMPWYSKMDKCRPEPERVTSK